MPVLILSSLWNHLLQFWLSVDKWTSLTIKSIITYQSTTNSNFPVLFRGSFLVRQTGHSRQSLRDDRNSTMFMKMVMLRSMVDHADWLVISSVSIPL